MARAAQLSLFPQFDSVDVPDERLLVGYLAALGAGKLASLSSAEQALLSTAELKVLPRIVSRLRDAIRDGQDPLGEAFSRLRSPAVRRPVGATYTPLGIVQAMVQWAATHAVPDRVVDPGVGSARFLVEAGRVFPDAQLVGVEVDPLAALIARTNLAVSGMAARTEILLGDYRSVLLPRVAGRTLFVGNPPYVRHHLIPAEWKDWLVTTSLKRGMTASQLAGLHVHFFLATLGHAQDGDYGALITAAEWLDVNYGKLVRDLFIADLGGEGIVFVEPTAKPFPDAATTAAITLFEVGSRTRSVRLARAKHPEDIGGALHGGAAVRRERLAAAKRWTPLLRAPRAIPEGYVELGELCRVHRGAVTGANRIWIEGEQGRNLPASVLFHSVTKARELFAAGAVLADRVKLRRVIDIPPDLDQFETEERERIDAFLRWARSMGADQGYIAKHRRAWWSVGLRPPPPIMATYMARRPPAFVNNLAGARYINIAHGIYPREAMAPEKVSALAAYLTAAAKTAHGRTYAGGLMKFEPKEMERIAVPRPELLGEG